jgi:hypothetical protein
VQATDSTPQLGESDAAPCSDSLQIENQSSDQTDKKEPESLWDLAYEEIRKADEDLITKYETLLSGELEGTGAHRSTL